MPLVSGAPEKIKRTRALETVRQPERTPRTDKTEKRAETETITSKATEIAALEMKTGLAPLAAVAAIQPAAPAKNPELLAVEKILEENVGELYAELPPERRVIFRREGERAAQLIWLMLQSAKIQAQKIFQLIRHWLKIIPGINRYFLEQESKIKTDKIIELAHERKGQK